MEPILRTRLSKTPVPGNEPARLRLKPGKRKGSVDGAWWPYSREPAVELPALIEALTENMDRISRVSFGTTTWKPAPHRIHVNDRLIRLGGFRSQNQDVLDVIGLDGRRLTLLVIPPATDETAGGNALRLASDPANTDAPATILATAATPHPGDQPTPADDATSRWETDGGRGKRTDRAIPATR